MGDPKVPDGRVSERVTLHLTAACPAPSRLPHACRDRRAPCPSRAPAALRCQVEAGADWPGAPLAGAGPPHTAAGRGAWRLAPSGLLDEAPRAARAEKVSARLVRFAPLAAAGGAAARCQCAAGSGS